MAAPAEGDVNYAAVKSTIELFNSIYDRLRGDGDDRPSENAIAMMRDMGSMLFPKKQIGNIPDFRYSKSMVFAKNVKRPEDSAGCNCEGSCSYPSICPCARLNVRQPYSNDGRLRKKIPIIYECGKKCACGPSCKIKKTQGGLEYRLEAFRTKQKGWGVRTRDFIRDGTYIGEYVGKIRTDEDADTKPDTYLFDIDIPGKKRTTRVLDAKYCIDGQKVGNFVRFINHSCDPNLFVQRILSDHHDLNFARITVFAGRDIAPMEELTYDYNYGINSVKVNGQIKNVKCNCLSPICRKRLM